MEIQTWKFDMLVSRYESQIKIIKESIDEYTKINNLGTWDSMIKMKNIRLIETEKALELLLTLKEV